MADRIVTQHLLNVDADADTQRRVTQLTLETDVNADAQRRVTQIILEVDIGPEPVATRRGSLLWAFAKRRRRR